MNATIEAALKRLNVLSKSPLSDYKNYLNVALCEVSQSTLAYFATVNPTETELLMIGWSNSAMMNCTMIDKPLLYKVTETGLWGDAIRERKPVITNDYPALVKPTKKGYPAGHVNVKRHMNLPIFENGKIVLVVGVGNKKDAYSMDDAKNIEILMSEAWKTLKTKL
jgi:hypothetical protein